MQTMNGLTEHEAQVRRQRCEGNQPDFGISRSYLGIARAKLFTFFMFTIGIALMVRDFLTRICLFECGGASTETILVGILDEKF